MACVVVLYIIIISQSRTLKSSEVTALLLFTLLIFHRHLFPAGGMKENSVIDPQNVRKYYRRKAEDNGGGEPDYLTILTLVVGMAGMTLQSKICCWVAVFLWLSSFANMKTLDSDYKQLMSAFTFSFMGLIMRYFLPPRVTKTS